MKSSGVGITATGFFVALSLIVPALYVAAFPEPPVPEPYCKRLPFDEEALPGVTGNYRLIGKDGTSGKTYAGTLEITSGKSAYSVVRTVQGRTMKGEAWVESCSPDKFRMLVVSYRPKGMKFSCYLQFDGDNYTRSSCTSVDGRGLEAWFQRN